MNSAHSNEAENTLLKHALYYAQVMGWAVIPLHSIVEGRCTCGNNQCPSPGKHPLVSSGLHGASKDPDQIRWWWNKWPKANIGIRTGIESGLSVIDVDPRHGGDISLETFEEYIPDTVVQLTGGGGYHFLFKHPAGNTRVKCRTNVLPGIDIRGDGGYIVASPSIHISGGTYEFEASSEPTPEFLPLSMPEQISGLMELYSEDEEASNISINDRVTQPLSDEEAAKIRSALEFIMPEDRDTWLMVGMALHDTGAAMQAFRLWDEWSQGTEVGNYNARSQRLVWRSFKSKKRSVTIDSIWKAAGKRGWYWEPVVPTTFHIDMDPSAFGVGISQPEQIGQEAPATTSLTQEPETTKGYKADESLAQWEGMRTFGQLRSTDVDQRERWWRGTTLRAKSKTIIVGMPKAKKTFFVLGMGMAAASGGHFGGNTEEYRFPRPLKTFWFQGEMQDDDTLERFNMMTNGMEGDQLDLIKENFMFSDALRWDLMNPRHFIRIEREIIKHRPELIFFDPFSKFNAVNENDNGEMLELLDRFDCLIRKHGVSIVLVHHTGKGAKAKIQNSTENPFDVMRGASALLGWMEAGMIIGPGDDGDSVRIIYEHRAQRVPEPHGMRLELTEENGRPKATWKLTLTEQEDGNFSGIIDDSESVNSERVNYIIQELKRSGAMTSGTIIAKLMKVFRIKERSSKSVISALYDNPFVTIESSGRTTLFHHVSEAPKA